VVKRLSQAGHLRRRRIELASVLERPADEANLRRVAQEVKAMCARFPVYA